MTQGKPTVGKRITAVAGLAKALGVRATDITATKLLPQVASTGVRSLQIPIRSVKTVRDMEPDMPALAKVLRRMDPEAGAYVFAFKAEGDADLHARGFFPQSGIPEDPATGSAAGACGAYLAANGRLPTKEWFVIEQGSEVHHPSRIEVSVDPRTGRAVTVRVAGTVVPVMRGTLTLP
jgi:PhzF family phenazine biosynthesis protein